MLRTIRHVAGIRASGCDERCRELKVDASQMSKAGLTLLLDAMLPGVALIFP